MTTFERRWGRAGRLGSGLDFQKRHPTPTSKKPVNPRHCCLALTCSVARKVWDDLTATLFRCLEIHIAEAFAETVHFGLQRKETHVTGRGGSKSSRGRVFGRR